MNLLPRDGLVQYIPHFLDEDAERSCFSELHQHTEWRQESVRVFGKIHQQPRLVAWHGDPGLEYTYSGLTLLPQPWTPTLQHLKKKIEEECGHSFNSVLINLYRDQSDSNGWHSDDEKELGPNPIIASLSLGEARDFHLRHKSESLDTIKIILEPGSLLLMGAKTQKYWKHCLPKRTRVLGPRINLTFRKILQSFEQ